MKFLYFYKETGCEHCAAAEPILDQWDRSQKINGVDFESIVYVVKLDLVYNEWKKLDYTPKIVPAYLYVIDKVEVARVECTFNTVNQIEKFIKKANNIYRGLERG